MKDFGGGCLEDMRKVEPKSTEQDLEAAFCKFCRNTACERSKWGGDPFSKRVNSQEDRFFNTPQVSQKEHSKWANLPDFVGLEHTAPLEIWTTPTAPRPVPPPLVSGKNAILPKSGLYVGDGAAPPREVRAPGDAWDAKPEKRVAPGARIKLDREGNIKK